MAETTPTRERRTRRVMLQVLRGDHDWRTLGYVRDIRAARTLSLKNGNGKYRILRELEVFGVATERVDKPVIKPVT